MPLPAFSRRHLLTWLAVAPCAAALGQSPAVRSNDTDPGDWVCPMDPDVRSTQPGKCPRCGMTLRLNVPDRIEFDLNVTHTPAVLRPGESGVLTFRITDPTSGQAVHQYSLVHEKLMHFFLVSEDLQFFAHLHPEPQPDGSFRLPVCLPQSGMYRLLADYYPSNSVPQLSVGTLYVHGQQHPAHLLPALAPVTGTNLVASLRTEPEKPIAGLETRLFYQLNPAADLQPYLGAWGHMLVASEDLIDLIHTHPFLADDRNGRVQFNVIFPRTGTYRIWAQFQRAGTVNTVAFNVPVGSL